jgi:hypothetical protein
VAEALGQDWVRPGRHDVPEFLRAHGVAAPPRSAARALGPKRQARHLGSTEAASELG